MKSIATYYILNYIIEFIQGGPVFKVAEQYSENTLIFLIFVVIVAFVLIEIEYLLIKDNL